MSLGASCCAGRNIYVSEATEADRPRVDVPREGRGCGQTGGARVKGEVLLEIVDQKGARQGWVDGDLVVDAADQVCSNAALESDGDATTLRHGECENRATRTRYRTSNVEGAKNLVARRHTVAGRDGARQQERPRYT